MAPGITPAFETLKNLIRTTHLHDNDQQRDAHLWPGKGTIDWKETMALLRTAPHVPALVLELSEDSLSVQASEPLPAADVPLRFILPGTAHLIEGNGEVIWADDTGRAGILFNDLAPNARRQLKAWLAKRSPKKETRKRVPARVRTSHQLMASSAE